MERNIIMSGNKVFYGEYTIKHWIDLILNKNIVLPKYQRSFVWNITEVSQLIKSIKNEQYVPPVTIGACKNINGENENLIIDGQQRLTSLLLAASSCFPKKENLEILPDFVDENDEQSDVRRAWTFRNLIEGCSSLTEIKDKTKTKEKEKYIEIDKEVTLSLEDLDKYYIGFSYLVPDVDNDDSNYQQQYYSTVFRNINIRGESLSEIESRESLYYWKPKYEKFFHPDFSNSYSIKDSRMDFVRYISLLSQYIKNHNKTEGLAYGFARKMEMYYENFIYFIVGQNETTTFATLDKMLSMEIEENEKKENLENEVLKECESRITNITNNLNKLDIEKKFKSIIDLDVTFFGLIYFSFLHGKNIDDSKKNALKSEINAKINELKNDGYHQNNPSAICHVKTRINCSIDIYRKYIL